MIAVNFFSLTGKVFMARRIIKWLLLCFVSTGCVDSLGDENFDAEPARSVEMPNKDNFSPDDCGATREEQLRIGIPDTVEKRRVPDWVFDTSKPIPRNGLKLAALSEYCAAIGRPVPTNWPAQT